MSQSLTTHLTRVVLVRDGFAEHDVWRDALGRAVPLHVWSMAGGFLDAPEWIPAGAMCASPYGPQSLAVNRTPWGN